MALRSLAPLLALAFMTVVTEAAPIAFTYTGGFQTYVIGRTGVYDIVAAGAQGGERAEPSLMVGGLGASVGGDVSLVAGQVLRIAVGGMGVTGGGGGGTFVVTAAGTPLVIAGGGGGAGVGENGFGGRIETSGGGYTTGGSVYAHVTVLGGVNGGGGGPGRSAVLGGGGGGGGFAGDGASSSTVLPNLGGKGYPNLSGGDAGSASAHGGFGGGGGGFAYGGGGGGGYSGGAGGAFVPLEDSGGRGGGSFLADDILQNSDLTQLAGSNSGNGFVTIGLVSTVPLPASARLFAAALLVLGVCHYGRGLRGCRRSAASNA